MNRTLNGFWPTNLSLTESRLNFFEAKIGNEQDGTTGFHYKDRDVAF